MTDKISLRDKTVFLSEKQKKAGNPHRDGTNAFAYYKAIEKAGARGLSYAEIDTTLAGYLHWVARNHRNWIVAKAASKASRTA